MSESSAPGAVPHFDRYAILARWATGGMAKIYVARQIGAQGFDKLVALKLMRQELASNPEFVDMFFAEARTGALLTHPNIVQTYDVGEVDGRVYMALEFINGESLSRIVRAMRRGDEVGVPVELACSVVKEMAGALHYAHTLADHSGTRLGLVHRDVSPSNIMLTHSGAVKLLDFGIAKVATRAGLTKAGQVKGKFSYMSPEQAQAKKLDGRSDVFALGLVFWQLLTGEKAFDFDNEMAILNAIVSEDLPPPSSLNPRVEAELDAIVRKATMRNRDERYANAAAFEADLIQYRARHFPGYDAGEAIRALMQEHFGKRAEQLRDLISKPVSHHGVGGSLQTAVSGLDGSSIPSLSPASFGVGLPSTGTGGSGRSLTLPGFEDSSPNGSAHRTGQAGFIDSGISQSGVAAVSQSQVSAITDQRSRNLMIIAMVVLALIAGGAVVYSLTAGQQVEQSSAAAQPDKAVVYSVSIASDPDGASVVVDGQPYGETPAKLELADGESKFVKIERRGYKPWSAQLTGAAGVAPTFAVLEPAEAFGTLVVNSRPAGATVTIDGAVREQVTPVVLSGLWIGEQHSVVVSLEGFATVARNVEFAESGETEELTLELQPTASGFVMATCPGVPCDVMINGENVGQTPINNHELAAKVPVAVQLLREGKVVHQQSFELKAGQLRQVEGPALAPPPSEVAVAAAATKASPARRTTTTRRSDDKKSDKTPTKSTPPPTDDAGATTTTTTTKPDDGGSKAALTAPTDGGTTTTTTKPDDGGRPKLQAKLTLPENGGSTTTTTTTTATAAAKVPSAKIISPRIDGLIDRRSVKNIIDGLEGKVGGCYTKAYASAAFEGTAHIEFFINTAGRATSVKVTGVDSSSFESCVRPLFQNETYPASSGSDAGIDVKVRLRAE